MCAVDVAAVAFCIHISVIMAVIEDKKHLCMLRYSFFGDFHIYIDGTSSTITDTRIYRQAHTRAHRQMGGQVDSHTDIQISRQTNV